MNVAYADFCPNALSTEAFYAECLRVAQRYAARCSQPDDVAQEACIYLWEHLAEYDPTLASFSTWLGKIVADHAHVHRRACNRQQTLPDLYAVEDDSLDSTTLYALAGENLGLVQLIQQGYTVQEVAVRLNTTPMAIYSRIKRLRAKYKNNSDSTA